MAVLTSSIFGVNMATTGLSLIDAISTTYGGAATTLVVSATDIEILGGNTNPVQLVYSLIAGDPAHPFQINLPGTLPPIASGLLTTLNTYIYDAGAVNGHGAAYQTITGAALDVTHAEFYQNQAGVAYQAYLTAVGNSDPTGAAAAYANVLAAGDAYNAELFGGNDKFNNVGGNDTLQGWGGNDKFFMHGGTDNVSAGNGNDVVNMFDSLTAADTLAGGAGSDKLTLAGNYAGGVTLTNVTGFEGLSFTDGFNYALTEVDGNVTAGNVLVVNASNLSAGSYLHFNGAAESDANQKLTGGAGSDVLAGGAGKDKIAGGAGDDSLTGGLGKDALTTGSGHDTLVYHNFAETDGDTLADFDVAMDHFDLSFAVTGIDASQTAVSTGNIANVLTAAHFGAHHAAIVTVGGTHTFLAVDADGVAGFTKGVDYLFNMDHATNLGSLSTGDFV